MIVGRPTGARKKCKRPLHIYVSLHDGRNIRCCNVWGSLFHCLLNPIQSHQAHQVTIIKCNKLCMPQNLQLTGIYISQKCHTACTSTTLQPTNHPRHTLHFTNHAHHKLNIPIACNKHHTNPASQILAVLFVSHC